MSSEDGVDDEEVRLLRSMEGKGQEEPSNDRTSPSSPFPFSSSSSSFPHSRSPYRWLLLLFSCVAVLVMVLLTAALLPSSTLQSLAERLPSPPPLCPSSPSHSSSAYSALFPVAAGRSLLLVVHATHDAHYADNLRYFLRKAVRCWQDADYVIVIQREDAASFAPGDDSWKAELPALPSNARYVLHQNECMDLGTVGWLLRLPLWHPDAVDTSRYRYFFLINTSVRGPLLPAFLEDRMDPDGEVQCSSNGPFADTSSMQAVAERGRLRLFAWFDVFLAQLSADVRVVGCTASCSFAAHVQSYVLAMDYVALQVMWSSGGLLPDEIPHPDEQLLFTRHWEARRAEGWTPPAQSTVTAELSFDAWQRQGGMASLPNTTQTFSCGGAFWDTVFNGEIGASHSVLRAGYNVAVMEPYWRGVDFRMEPNICARLVGELPFNMTNHYENGVPATRLQAWDGQMYFNDPLQVVFTKSKANKALGSDARLQLQLQWEDLHRRTVIWQRAHQQRNAT